MYFRTGLLDPTKKTAEKLTAFYRDKDIDEMVFICPAGYNMFTNVLPLQFGAHFNFKTRFFTDWMTDALDRGMFEIKRKLDKSVVIHDSCHARVLGSNFMDDQRRLLKRLGMTIKETPLNKEKGLCCGMAAGANKFSVTDLTRSAVQGLSALDSADGEEIGIYCSGCLLMLSTARPLNPFGKKLVHFLEYIRYSLGEEVPRRNMKRAVSIMKGVALHSLPHYFSKKYFQYD
jgi:Fe-S oxidoreductase